MSERLAEHLRRHQAYERERALRALLIHPLMTVSNPNFGAVRRHGEELRAWLVRESGWTLRVERDCARLYKIPSDLGDASRGAEEFSRQHYVLLCLICAVLERADAQITLRSLGERVLELATSPDLQAAGFAFTLEQARERREFVQVCRYLIGLGLMHRLAGEEESYVSHGGDALYDVQRRALAAMLACTRGPSTLSAASAAGDWDARLAEITSEYVSDNPEARRTAIRHGIARRLLDDPVVYFDELLDDEQEYLANQRGAMAARLASATGLRPELRAEGLALVDPDAELTDAAMPAEGTEAHATLLVAEFLAERARSDPPQRVPTSQVAAFLREQADTYGRYWRKAAREPGAERDLAEQALQRLAALKLVQRDADSVRPRPALARFRVGQPDLRPSRQPDLPLR